MFIINLKKRCHKIYKLQQRKYYEIKVLVEDRRRSKVVNQSKNIICSSFLSINSRILKENFFKFFKFFKKFVSLIKSLFSKEIGHFLIAKDEKNYWPLFDACDGIPLIFYKLNKNDDLNNEK